MKKTINTSMQIKLTNDDDENRSVDVVVSKEVEVVLGFKVTPGS